MSKGWPDPFHDKDDDFWDFDNMVNEYDYEQRRQDEKLQEQLRHEEQQKRIWEINNLQEEYEYEQKHRHLKNAPKKEITTGWIVAVIVLLVAAIVCITLVPLLGIVLWIVFFIVLFSR